MPWRMYNNTSKRTLSLFVAKNDIIYGAFCLQILSNVTDKRSTRITIVPTYRRGRF